MWSYYGSKSKVINHYPPPKEGKIIEPFAGTARYALKYFDRDILLVDKYKIVIDVWHYLQSCSEKDILKLPILKAKEDLRNYSLSEIEKQFLGFVITGGSYMPCNIVSPFGGKDGRMKNTLKKIASNLYKIKHWNIIEGNYIDLENEKATWFIDPPYQFGGHKYIHSNKLIDFNELKKWCESRNGHTIVCENTKADWMDFKPMKEMTGTKFKTTEAIWSNLPTAFDNEQLKIF